jgi:hypothetical protein
MPVAARVGTLTAAFALCAAVLVPVTASASPAARATAREPAGVGGNGAPELDHVFIIMLENHEADHVIGDPSAPYITSLADQYDDDDGWYTGNHYPDPKIAGNHFPHTNRIGLRRLQRG